MAEARRRVGRMQAMDPTSGNFYQEDGKDLDFYDFEPLPTVTEDEVSPGPVGGPHRLRRRSGVGTPPRPQVPARGWALAAGGPSAVLSSPPPCP